MATSAFRSVSRRTPLGSSSSTDEPGYSSRSRSQRRARSLSRFPQRFSELDSFNADQFSKGRFVNKFRGSQFFDVSLDDLAIELFSEEKDSLSGITDLGQINSVDNSQRRGRSVSRHGFNSTNGKSGVCNGSTGVKNCSDRRRRSISAVRPQNLDNEKSRNHRNESSDRRSSTNKSSSEKSNSMVLQKCQSQRDISTSRKTYSNRSFAETDDGSYHRLGNSGFERTIRAVHSETKQHPVVDDVMNNYLYEVMRKELRHAVEDIRNELKQDLIKTKPFEWDDNSVDVSLKNLVSSTSIIRKNHSAKYEQTGRRKKDVPGGELLLEEHELEHCQTSKELNPVPENTAIAVKPSYNGKRNNDRSGMSKRLIEGAEKYFEEFISSVEETEISSFDEDRSDGGSVLRPKDPPLESCDRLDGVTLPWLLWETCNDSPHKTPQYSIFSPPSKEECSIGDSWSPNACHSDIRKNFIEMTVGCASEESKCGHRELKCKDDDDDEDICYFQKTEILILEKFIQRERVGSGGLLLCDHFHFF